MASDLSSRAGGLILGNSEGTLFFSLLAAAQTAAHDLILYNGKVFTSTAPPFPICRRLRSRLNSSRAPFL
jgi:hypothetical protein